MRARTRNLLDQQITLGITRGITRTVKYASLGVGSNIEGAREALEDNICTAIWEALDEMFIFEDTHEYDET